MNPNTKTANFLLGVAILIELCMAGLGVAIGLAIISRGYVGVEVAGIIKFIPGFVFIAIAVVELTRVPLVISIYRGRSLWWRWVGGMFLLLIMGITFESMLIGLQTNNMYALSEVTNQDIVISRLEDKIILKEQKILKTQTDTEKIIQNNYENVILSINNNEDKRITPLKDKVLNLNKQYSSGQVAILNSEINDVQKEIDSLPQRERELINEAKELRNNELKNISTKYKNKRTDLNTRIQNNILDISSRTRTKNQKKDALFGEKFLLTKTERDDIQQIIDNLNKENEKLNKNLLNLSSNESKEISSVTSKFNDQINAIRNQSVISNKSLKKTINASKQEIIKVQSTEKLGVQEEIKNLEKTIEAAYNDFNNQREEAKKNRDKNLNNLKEKKQVIENLNKDIEKYQDELAKVKAEKSNLTKTNIVYNLATHLTTIVKSCEEAENPEDVTPQCRKVTENIWFGLISFIVSATGTAVALGSEVLRNAHLQKNKQRPMRYMFARILRNVTRPKIKIKEVPIEKIVEVTKIVPEDKVIYKEVPKIHEVIKKEYVHIPVPTAREDLIKDKDKNKDKK